jgi:3-oxoacyl-[acyl-carrier protein] reductase
MASEEGEVAAETVSYRSLSGKCALVTGGAKGIGAGIAKAMASAGANVVVNYAHDRDGAERTVEAIEVAGGRAMAVQANVSVVSEVQQMIAKSIETFGRLDILVNNASVFSFSPLSQASDESLRTMIDVNLRGTIVTCREALIYLCRQGGSIINIGSMSSVRYSAGSVGYAATKAGVTGVTGVLAVELASRGIRVNQINPGAVDTEGARAVGAMTEEARAAHIAKTPLGRVGIPSDIASVAVFLASDAAGWLTGECLSVSGGLR